MLRNKLIPGTLRRFGWRVFTSLARLLPVTPLTPFATAEQIVRKPNAAVAAAA